KVELKPEPKVELKSKIIVDKEQEKQILEEDPFAGISTKDIENYSDFFDAPPPENDEQARKLASDIKKWISQGRPKKQEQQVESKTTKEEIAEIDDEKPKKKRSLFGWVKK
ncbi:MAG: signal recognition particle-docking protein FtsY, partial [Nitrosotalea sp.]